MNQKNTRRGFTLIELLVVVLIIGILAAVAVPQYQKAVWKSRFATIKHLTKSIANAEEVYYLANGNYTKDWDALDVSLDGARECTNEEDTDNYCYFNWGYCLISYSLTQTRCDLQNKGEDFLSYKIMYDHINDSKAGERQCFARNVTSDTDIQVKICKEETGRTARNTGSVTAPGYTY